MKDTIDFTINEIWIKLWPVITANVFLSWSVVLGIVASIATIYKNTKQ